MANTVHLPEAPASEGDAGAPAPGDGCPPRVLVVDDDPALRQLIRRTLVEDGCEASEAGDASSAIAELETALPDLILLDVNLPDGSGFDVCARIKESPRWKNIPVLLVSGLARVEDQVRGFAAGADDFLTKPIGTEILTATVRTQIRNKIARDELAASRTQVALQNAEMMRLEKAKDSFMHMLVHDLKGPLGALELDIDLLQKLQSAPADELGQTTLRNLGACASKLRGMVQNILIVAQMENTGVRLRPSRLAFDGLLDANAVCFRGLAAARSQTFSVELEPGVPAISADVNLISRVLDNLVSNACRMSRNGADLVLSAAAAGDGGVVVSVADRGPGVPEALRSKIFEKYVTSTNAIASHGVNQGLGLTFSKLAVEGHGGRIWVEPREGGGSRFRFALPSEPVAPVPCTPAAAEVGA
jgi:signal transduction histidine kinase